jgi:hypothetical protein
VVATKEQSQRLCGMVPSDADQHKPVPALAVVDEGLGPMPVPEARAAAARDAAAVPGVRGAEWFGLMRLALEVEDDHPPVEKLISSVCAVLAEHRSDSQVHLSFTVPGRGWNTGLAGEGRCP